MAGVVVFLIGDNSEQTERLKKQLEGQDVSVQVFQSNQWKEGLDSPLFRQSVGGNGISLVSGSQPVRVGTPNMSNVVPFPVPGANQGANKVTKMEELELEAIQNAIKQFNGNLTEAAKALGIGRATLYRRVKYFKIDPNQSRRRRVA
jgi:transcriptional regulator with GAF, ATPase, and Fis domain